MSDGYALLDGIFYTAIGWKTVGSVFQSRKRKEVEGKKELKSCATSLILYGKTTYGYACKEYDSLRAQRLVITRFSTLKGDETVF